MASEITDWLNLLLRFIHVLAAIMWVGSSIFFVWLDLHLERGDGGDKADDEGSEGSLWMIHGGGIFHADKRLLRPEEIPKTLHWFKWEAYGTWLSGFFLLAVIHYLNGGATLPAAESGIGGGEAILWSLGLLSGGWMVYDLLWRTRWFRANGLAGSAISLALLVLASALLCHLYNGRAAFLHVGAMLGTLMAGNVFLHIIPNQRVVMRNLDRGEPHDLGLSRHAKLRSMHNNYMTFPVIFLMISFHYPMTYGSPHAWAVLAVMVVGLMVIKHLLNIRHRFSSWLPALVGTFLVMALGAALLARLPARGARPAGPPVDPQVAAGKKLYGRYACATCHLGQAPKVAPYLNGIYMKPQRLADGTEVIVDEAYLRESILQPQAKVVEGYQPIMPPVPLQPEELDQLVAYLKTL